MRLLVEGVESHTVRLMVRVRVRTPDGWTDPRSAMIDTGSPYCVVPHSVWSIAEHRFLRPHPLPLGGIGGGTTNAPLGEITLVVEDDVTASPPLTIRALLLPDDSEPLLLGFEDFLTVVILHCDYESRDAYLEFRLR